MCDILRSPGNLWDLPRSLFFWFNRFRSILDKARQGGLLLADEIAIGFVKDVPGVDGVDGGGTIDDPETTLTNCPTATSSLTEVDGEGGLGYAWGFPAESRS